MDTLDSLPHVFSPDIHGPVVPVFLSRIHPEDLHLLEGVDRIGNGVFKAFTDVPDAAHPLPLISLGGFRKKVAGCYGALAYDGEIGQWKIRKVSYFRNLEDALGEDRDQLHPRLLTYLINTPDSLKTSTRCKDIDPTGQVVSETVTQKEGNR